MVPKLKMLRIYWNFAHLIFQISRFRFLCQRLFLLNIYHLLGPNWSQNEKYSEFIKIWHIILNMSISILMSKMLFLSNIYQLLRPNWSQNKKCSEFINVWPSWYFKYAGLNFDMKIDTFDIFIMPISI